MEGMGKLCGGSWRRVARVVVSAHWSTVVVLLVLMAGRSTGEVIITGHTGGTQLGQACTGGGNTVGWKFTVGANDLAATSVGHYDQNLDGLPGSVEIGVWDSGGALVAMGLVPSGTMGTTLIDDFRYTPLAMPITLFNNQSYTIGARCTGDGPNAPLDIHGVMGDSVTFSTDFTAAGGRFNNGGLNQVFSEPTMNLGGLIYLGPNLEYVVLQTSTPTATPTATPSNTPSATPTSTGTPTATPTPTSTPTQTPTNTPAPIGAGCSEDADCDSGFCVDGVCCDTACSALGEACNFPLNVGTCVIVPTAVPATSSRNLLYAAALLLAVAALALRRSKRRS